MVETNMQFCDETTKTWNFGTIYWSDEMGKLPPKNSADVVDWEKDVDTCQILTRHYDTKFTHADCLTGISHELEPGWGQEGQDFPKPTYAGTTDCRAHSGSCAEFSVFPRAYCKWQDNQKDTFRYLYKVTDDHGWIPDHVDMQIYGLDAYKQCLVFAELCWNYTTPYAPIAEVPQSAIEAYFALMRKHNCSSH